MISDPHPSQEAFSRLKKYSAAFTFASMLVLGSAALLIHNQWEIKYTLRWLAISAVGVIYLSRILWRHLDQNYRPGEVMLLPTLGPGNTLTLLRGVLLASLAGFIFSPPPEGYLAWAPALIYTLAITIDILDGYAARNANHVTRLGETLDISLDGLGVSIASILAIQYGTLPFWYIVVPLARYLFLAGIGLRKRIGLEVHELKPSIRRRIFAAVQMAFLSTMLWPIFTPPGTILASFFFALPFLIGFVVDWLVMCGLLRPNQAQQFTTAFPYLITFTPLALRLAVLVLMLALVSYQTGNFPNPPLHNAIVSGPEANIGIFILWVEIGVFFMLAFGAAGRVAAIAGLLLLGIQQNYLELNLVQYSLIGIYTAILYLGTGKFSLWKPEDRLIFKDAGQSRAFISEDYHASLTDNRHV